MVSYRAGQIGEAKEKPTDSGSASQTDNLLLWERGDKIPPAQMPRGWALATAQRMTLQSTLPTEDPATPELASAQMAETACTGEKGGAGAEVGKAGDPLPGASGDLSP